MRIIVTGAAGGIGAALVGALLSDGARIVAVDRSDIGLEALRRDAEDAGSRVRTVCADLCDDGAGAAVVAEAMSAFGGLDALVCNAGIGRIQYTDHVLGGSPKAWEVPQAIWRRFFEVNTLAAIALANAAVPALSLAARARIVFVTTSLDSMLNAGTGPYGPSKAALEAYASVLAAELEPSAVTVNVLVPGGATDTPMIPETPGIARSSLLPPSVMVEPLRWLLSPAGDAVTARRFRADRWSSGDAGEPIAWRSLARGQRRILSPQNEETPR